MWPVADVGILEGALVLRNFEKATAFGRLLGLSAAMGTIKLIAEALSDLRWRKLTWTHFTPSPPAPSSSALAAGRLPLPGPQAPQTSGPSADGRGSESQETLAGK